MADFETTTREENCRVWGWGLADISTPDDVEINHTIDQFIERISEQNSICYFHNLKFDGRFILDWLLKHGYDHVDSDRQRGLNVETFTSLISSMGRFYSLTVKWGNGNTTEFRDSANKIPLSIARIAKAFKLPILKGDIDYHAERPIDHKITPEEAEYIRNDVSIGAHAMKQVLESGMKRLTVASDSLAQFKELAGKHFERFFPVLSDHMDSEIRKAYRGGFTYADPRFSGRITGAGIVLDVNSLYPAVMKNCAIPYGEPQFVPGKVEVDDDYPVAIFAVTFTAKLKSNHIPCIQIKGSSMFTPTEYQTVISEPTTLMMTNVDFALYQDHYDMEILEWGGGYRFHAAVGMFDSYINKWAKIKEESVGGQREIAKLHLNSLYGKFATNPKVSSKIPVLDGDTVKLVIGEDKTRPPVYTAAGVFITSYARDLTIRAAQANYGAFAYADTDSLHLLFDDVPSDVTAENFAERMPDIATRLDIHPTRMGAWKFEYAFEAAYYVRAKQYFERKHDGTYVNRVAGLPEAISAKITHDDLKNGTITIHGKLQPKAVPGGIVLVDVPFQLKL